MSNVLGWALATPIDVHRGVPLPAARFVVLAVPIAALAFYVFVVRTRRK
ncbi:MAG: hypothetical protein KGL23_01190 [Acidobacteriota bacterium]|nr:hypothetical protein [Acidobacteriota bacterium]MDE3030003.1 hypothetical protein [Acidobacteriota bacterium]MDE3093710.1 hypothetical protein [Acidobacteriota bacterium]MDE3138338.1 hypothetical protein [Acidobacteriota bacterium]MDE3146034.1 hypothetical protein [Acidobacteriota bacterium]